MKRVACVILVSLIGLSLLVACAPGPVERASVAQSANGVEASVATWAADSKPPATSTVKAPKLPTFPQGAAFVVEANGSGKAVARFTAPTPTPDEKRWHRTAKFVIEQSVIDGLWVDSLIFWGRLGEDTIITTREQSAFGSNEFVTVSRRVRDILRDDPEWQGLEDNARVSLTFTVDGTGPVKVQTITGLDPTFKTVRLSDPGPHYAYGAAPDPVIGNAIVRSDGTTGSIIGYLVDYKDWKSGNGPVGEFFVDKAGGLFRSVGAMGRPRSAFGQAAQPRSGPESSREAAARTKAVARGLREVRRHPELSAATGVVYGYLVRVARDDGTSVDVVVGNDGRFTGDAQQVKLQPWSPPIR